MKGPTPLVSGYYTWEKVSLTCALLLLLNRLFGLAANTNLPLIQAQLDNSKYFPGAVSIIALASLVLVGFDWKISSKEARSNWFSRLRLAFLLSVASVAFWVNIPLLTAGTSIAEVPRYWYLLFLFLGLLIGWMASDFIFATLFISRNPSSGKFYLPVFTRALYCYSVPMLFVLLYLDKIASAHAPAEFLSLATFLICVPIVYIFIRDYFFVIGDDGKLIPFRSRFARLRDAVKKHDYSYLLAKEGPKVVAEARIPTGASPQEYQKTIRKRLAQGPRFSGIVLDEFQIENYYIEPSKGQTADNLGVRFILTKSQATGLRVKVWPRGENPPTHVQQLRIELSLLEKHALNYSRKHFLQKIDPIELLNYSLDQAMFDLSVKTIHNAIEVGRPDLVQEFLSKGVDVNSQNDAGWTPLLCAVANGYPKFVRLLLEHGGNPDIANLQGVTPLMFSARYGNLPIAKILVETGAKLDFQDKYGATAVAIAAMLGQDEMVRHLVSKGANIQISDREGKTPLDCAYAGGHGKIAKFLRKQTSGSI